MITVQVRFIFEPKLYLDLKRREKEAKAEKIKATIWEYINVENNSDSIEKIAIDKNR